MSYTSANFSQKPQAYSKDGSICLQEYYSFHIDFWCAGSTFERKLTLYHSITSSVITEKKKERNLTPKSSNSFM